MAIIKIARFWPGGQPRRAASAAAAIAEPDGLDAFGSEQEGTQPGSKPVLVMSPLPGAPLPARPRRNVPPAAKWALVVIVSAGLAAAGMWAYQRRVATRATVSQLVVETTPPGADVVIAGQLKGRTPLTLDLPAGAYDVQIGSGAQQRVIHATLTPGRTLVERMEMRPVVVAGALHVATEPTGLPVQIDGADKGRSPVNVADLAPGEHQILVAGPSGPLRRTVSVRPNETVSLIVSAAERPTPNASGGYLTVASSLPLQLREDGKVIGASDMDRVMLPAGDHTLELVNEALGFRAQRRVSIAAGKTARLEMQLPNGTLSINAQPWAEVWLDGKRLGETPLGGVSAPIGQHEIVFRHPDLGERRTTVTVGTKEPARVGMDMRGK